MNQLEELSDLVEITTTVALSSDAERLATAIVTEKVAACVQITGPIQSVYEWEGKIQIGTEYGLKLKTTVEAMRGAIAFLKQNHPYDLPEMVVHFAKTSPEYGDWVHRVTCRDAD